jgi:hypothetical protein
LPENADEVSVTLVPWQIVFAPPTITVGLVAAKPKVTTALFDDDAKQVVPLPVLTVNVPATLALYVALVAPPITAPSFSHW